MDFQVELANYNGPLDLLLHIVRREELDLAELPLARIIDQYLDYLEVLVELQIDDVGDFLEVASILIEMKSKHAVPNAETEVQDSDGQPLPELSEDLVQRLMEYKRIRDACTLLDAQSHQWQMRYSRLADDLPTARPDGDLQAIEPLEIWDLVSAFARILREQQAKLSTKVVYDETPIQTYMSRIHQLVCQRSRLELTSLFEPGMHKSTLVAMFLATLELTRHHGVTTLQSAPQQPLYLLAGKGFSVDAQFSSPAMAQ